MAVDRILLTLREQGYTDFCRVGSIKKIHKNLLPFTHTAKTNKKAADKEALKELRDMLKELEFASGPRGQMT